MKKVKAIVLAAVAMIVTSCGTQGNILGGILQGGTLGNVIISVIGAQKVTAQDLIGAWNYSGPGCAFTSENLLAKAGGEVAATRIKEKALPYYQQIGITSQNTNVTFKQDGTYTATFRGTPMSGKWTYDEASSKVTLQSMLLTINCYAKRNYTGIGLLFESSKLLTILQAMAAMSGNQNIQAVGEISKTYDGLRLGFDFSK
ncbi:MAG: DUF4923 family protein [Prevotella sp.]|jgi:hypothetical protein|nr:DUF4923 family protein [Prevotella sp.]